ncbi:MAG: linear amide C-N hydrolase, partial [Plesiomonas sp.]
MKKSYANRKLPALMLSIACGLFALQPVADACTRVFWNDNQFAPIVGRTMDWPGSTEPSLVVFPRGMQRDGGMAGSEVVVAENPAKWISKYGSIVTTIYGIGTADGVNERGLGAHMQYLQAADFGPRDVVKPGVQATLWAQYILDNAANVKEAIELLNSVQIVMLKSHGYDATVHLAIDDASGDSAIVEYVEGKMTIYHGREHKIMTNDPTYDKQLVLLKKHDFSKPSSDTPLPGNVKATDRFQRAAYFSALLPNPKDERSAIASMFSIVRNVSVPFGAPYAGLGV